MRTGPRDEAGSATITGLLWIGVLLVIGVCCALGVLLIVQHRQSQAAADLAALAGAQAHQDGQDVCGAVHSVAHRNQATVTSCRLLGDDVLVSVSVHLPSVFEGLSELRARARAGPVGP